MQEQEEEEERVALSSPKLTTPRDSALSFLQLPRTQQLTRHEVRHHTTKSPPPTNPFIHLISAARVPFTHEDQVNLASVLVNHPKDSRERPSVHKEVALRVSTPLSSALLHRSAALFATSDQS